MFKATKKSSLIFVIFPSCLYTAKVEVIVCNLGDGLVDVLKIVYFVKPVAKQVAEAIASGNA